MKSNILKKFGNEVRAARERQGLSQEQLASKSGVHRTYIGMIERGEKNITLLNIEKVGQGLGVDLDRLFKNI